jgi:hypothetical protein
MQELVALHRTWQSNVHNTQCEQDPLVSSEQGSKNALATVGNHYQQQNMSDTVTPNCPNWSATTAEGTAVTFVDF